MMFISRPKIDDKFQSTVPLMLHLAYVMLSLNVDI